MEINYNPNDYLNFDNNFIPIFRDALAGDPKALDMQEIKSLGLGNIKKALEWLQRNDLNTDYKDLLAKEGWRLAYKRKPPTPEEYLSPEWIGVQSEGVWPNVKKAFLEFMDPNPLNPKRGLALSTSIGWGKSLLSNLCVSYDMVDFCLRREPFRQLGHSAMTSYSQPYGTLIQLKDGSWKPIECLVVGDDLMPLLNDESKVTNVIEQGEQDTYELDFGDNKKIRCSLGHWWLVWDFLEKKYVKIQTKEFIEAQDRYGVPELEDLQRDKSLILKCHKQFEKSHTFYENFGFEIRRS